MTTTYVIFDTRSGQIVSVHHGAVDAKEARECAQHHRRHDGKISEEHIAVIPVPPGAVDKEKLYKVDVGRNVLVTAVAQDGGVSFSFGTAGGLPKGA
ncbi:MAG: hypothetical protein ACR2KT_05680 [Methylocella sp.]|nr:MAG: hypothetical protein DLM68_12925 [Hyphomicrobiales bacterium]